LASRRQISYSLVINSLLHWRVESAGCNKNTQNTQKKADKIYLTSADDGLIRYEKLTAELSLPTFVTMPNIRRLIDELSRPHLKGLTKLI
jgi:hypothetical protein